MLKTLGYVRNERFRLAAGNQLTFIGIIAVGKNLPGRFKSAFPCNINHY